ncbi:MAG: thiamine-phosphate kinase [Bacteroidales bacterium]|nr:thiamine-phosphate kinase [Porphyromonas sp.]MDD6934542.1 thiamine-phosphate kinase [Bacteroidales bacterium]MDY3102275.1 thiamine-phosphate kinase [Porphyromonas sp.]
MPTPISELGEFALIERLTQQHKTTQASTLKGVGDDAAVLQTPEGQSQVITTDLLLEGIHFDLTYVPLKHLGYKAVMVNLSDVFAMNAQPTQITVSIGISSKFSVEQIDEFYEGVYLAASRFGVDVVGGDTSASLNGLVISITAIGYAPKEDIVYRSGAKPTDLICVSGNLGAAYMGLMLLEREKRVFEADPTPYFSPDFDGREYLIERQLKPEARGDVIAVLRGHGIRPTAMLDISDGLSSELLHLAKASGVGIRLYEERIPIDHETHSAASDLHLSPFGVALNGGEDYELLFTIPLSYADEINKIAGIQIIGHTTEAEEGTIMITCDGSLVPIEAQGWNAQKKLSEQQ